MKIFCSVLLFFCSCFHSYAQNEQSFKTPKILELINKADECAKQGAANCDQVFKEAANLARQSKQDDWDLINHKLAMYYFRTNAIDSVWKYLELGLKNSNTDEAYDALLSMKSQVLYNQGASDSAIKVMIQLANRLEKSKQTDKLAYTLANIGIALYAQDDFENSMFYLEKSFKLLEAIQDTVYLTTVAGNIADGYYSLHQDSLAKEWAYKTLSLKKTARGYEGQTLAYMTLAKIYSHHNTDSALWACQKAIAIAELNNDKEKLGNVYALYADNLMNTQQFQAAQVQIEKSINAHRAILYLPGLAHVLETAGKISLKNRLFEKAANYYQESITLNESLKSESKFKTISELTTKYETEKKERLLAEQQLVIQQKNAMIRNWWIGGVILFLGTLLFFYLLRKNQRQRLLVLEQENENAVLKAIMNGEEQERNRISNNLHDGVAAMLGAAKMSLHSIPFLKEENKNEQIEKVATIIGNTHADIRRIAHDLLPVTLEREGLIAAVNQFAVDINQMALLNLKIDNQLSADFSFPKRTELMLYRIIQELVNNILKHSKASTATIHFRELEQQIEIEVEDNGVGFQDENENQGLYSIRERLRTIGGKFQIEGKQQLGSRAKLILNIG